MELGVRKDQALNVVVTGGELGERRDREAERGAVDRDRLAGGEGGDVGAEEWLAVAVGAGLEAGFFAGGTGQEDEGAAGDRSRVSGRRERKPERLRGNGWRSEEPREACCLPNTETEAERRR